MNRLQQKQMIIRDHIVRPLNSSLRLSESQSRLRVGYVCFHIKRSVVLLPLLMIRSKQIKKFQNLQLKKEKMFQV